ncbi:MAG: hypothetical protein R3251_00420 [Candidatus Spechtbacterales bacterium]|nr:hypothetical protein [Candidatus Spechtbacterales bacterium]
MKRFSLLIFLLIVTAASYLIYIMTEDISLALMVGVDLFVAVTVLSFAFVQIALNRRLIQLQDYVAVSIVPDPTTPRGIRFYNTGKLNVYIHRIEVRDGETNELIGATEIFNNPRLLPAGTLDESYYWYPIPEEVKIGQQISLVLLATDEFDRRWLSSHGGVMLGEKDLRVWSHKTHQKDWKIYKKGEKVPPTGK